jgi:hypothetical protein
MKDDNRLIFAVNATNQPLNGFAQLNCRPVMRLDIKNWEAKKN